MRLESEILLAIAADGGDPARVQYTVVDGRGGYFRNVKKLDGFSEREIVLRGRRGGVRVEGERLRVQKLFAGDCSVLGDIRKVERME